MKSGRFKFTEQKGMSVIIGDKITCFNCKREPEKDEKVAMITNPRELNGYANLKYWATDRVIYCSQCFGELN